MTRLANLECHALKPPAVDPEALADRLRRYSQFVDKLAWDLDEALSAQRKDAAGYRRKSKANPDGGASYLKGELEAAVAAAEAFLANPHENVINRDGIG